LLQENTITTTITMPSRYSLVVGILTAAILSPYWTTTAAEIRNELLDMDGTLENHYQLPLPIDYIDPDTLPESFNWGDVNGVSYLTRSLNQHVPQYCGSCWAHAALSSLADRIKIARNAQGDDINLSVQYILNCGREIAGSCHGGSPTGLFHFVKSTGFVPYDTCQPYLACSSESIQGFCPHVDTTCSAISTCKTCTPNQCREIDIFPNATIAEYGTIDKKTVKHNTSVVEAIRAEIFVRGPVVAVIAGHPLTDYRGGIFDDVNATRKTTHAVSLVGWGTEEETGRKFWIVRNSWGQYWGEMGYFKILMGQNVLGIERKIMWAVPGTFTVMNYPCFEDGKNCGPVTEEYMDPSHNVASIQRRLRGHAA
jgi:cathepsin X